MSALPLAIKQFFSDVNNLLLFVLLLTPFIYIEPLFNHVDLPRSAFIVIISSLWLLAWLIQSSKSRKTINWHPLIFLVLFLLVFSATSYFWGRENTLYQTEIYFYTSLAIILFLSMQLNTSPIHNYALIISVIAFICASIGILQNFNINPLGYEQLSAPAATFMNKNFAANYLDLILPASLSVFLISRNKKEAWFSAIFFSVILSYILITKSRGAYLATLVTFLLFFISIHLFPFLKKQAVLISRKYKAQIVFIILCPIILFSLPSQIFKAEYEEARYQQFFSGGNENSISTRLHAYQNSIDLFKEQPVLGVGLGGFQLHFRPYIQSTLAKNKIFTDLIYLHSEPLQLLVELGVIGFIIVFVFLFSLLYLVIKKLINYSNNIFSAKEVNQSVLYIGFIIAIIASLFHSLFSFPLHQPTSALFFTLYLGILLGSLSKKTLAFNKYKKTTSFLLPILVALYLIVLSNFYYKYITSSYYMQKASSSFELGECKKAVDWSIISNNIYGEAYFDQTQGLNILSTCSQNVTQQLAFSENVLKYNPMHPGALFMAGMSYYHLGNYDLSKKLHKSVSFLSPYFTGSYTFLGHIAIKQKEFQKAKFLFKQAFILEPKNNTAQYFMKQLEKEGY